MTEETKTGMRSRISTSELERRWAALRRGMSESGLDFLILQNSSTIAGGGVRWVTDIPLGAYPATVIFPRDDEMTTIWHGPRPPAEPGPPAMALRGVKKRISVPIVPSLGYSSVFDAEKVVEELAPYGNCRVGLVGLGCISAAFYKYLTEYLNTVRLEDATDLVDALKAVKSEEEIRLVTETCRMQDQVFDHALTCVRPGRRDYEVSADLVHRSLELGGEQTNILVGSALAGTAARILPASFGNRLIEDGDQVVILIETSGPSGFWGEIGRTICLSKVSSELQEQFELAREAQKVTLDLLKRDTFPAAAWDANNRFLRSVGYPEERRIYAHGQGYDMVERPSLDPSETIRLQARMVLAVHPEVTSSRANGWVCENYLIRENGPPECLHATPQKLFVI